MKKTILATGKSKTIYTTDDPNLLVMEFRDDATAFNGVKKASLARKGKVNNHFNAHVMQLLAAENIAVHFVKLLSETESLVKKLDMIRIEFVVRNVVAGGISKRLGIEEGMVLPEPTLELFLKDDALGDPMINESHVHVFNWAKDEEIAELKQRTLRINTILKAFFAKAGLTLVDFKLEFGRADGKLLLGDEFTLDGCRVWDTKTQKKFDKDRFRRDLGEVIESYEEAAERLGIDVL